MTVTTDRQPTGHRRLLARAGALVLATGVAVLGLAGPASAHVRVDPGEATQGSYAALTFRVPNESSTAATTKLEIALPGDSPFASVSVKPIPGWKATTTSAKLAKPIDAHGTQVTEAVNRVTFTATSKATGIQPGEFQEFKLSVGPLPDKDKIYFKALQTYSDGQISRWIEEQTGSEEPENPAPMLTLVKGSGDGHDDDGDAAPSQAAAATSTSDDSGNGLAIGLGVAGLVAGVAGLIAGLMALRRSTATPASES